MIVEDAAVAGKPPADSEAEGKSLLLDDLGYDFVLELFFFGS